MKIRRAIRALALFGVGAAGLTAAGAGGGLLWLRSEEGNDWLLGQARTQAGKLVPGGTVEIADLETDILGGVTLEGVVLRREDGKPLIQAEKLTIRYGLLPLLRQEVRVKELTLTGPVVEIQQVDTEQTDLMLALGAKPKPDSGEPPQPWKGLPWLVTVDELRVEAGRFAWLPLEGAPVRVSDIALKGRARAGKGAHAAVEDVELSALGEGYEPVTLTGAAAYDESVVTTEGLRLRYGETVATVTGRVDQVEVDPGMGLHVELDPLAAGALQAWTQQQIPALPVRLSADLTGPLSDLSVQGIASSEAGSARIAAWTNLEAAPLAWRAQVDAEQLQLQPLLPSAITQTVTLQGRYWAEGAGTSWPQDLTADLRIDAGEQVIWGEPVPRAQIQARLEAGKLTFTAPSRVAHAVGEVEIAAGGWADVVNQRAEVVGTVHLPSLGALERYGVRGYRGSATYAGPVAASWGTDPFVVDLTGEVSGRGIGSPDFSIAAVRTSGLRVRVEGAERAQWSGAVIGSGIAASGATVRRLGLSRVRGSWRKGGTVESSGVIDLDGLTAAGGDVALAGLDGAVRAGMTGSGEPFVEAPDLRLSQLNAANMQVDSGQAGVTLRDGQLDASALLQDLIVDAVNVATGEPSEKQRVVLDFDAHADLDSGQWEIPNFRFYPEPNRGLVTREGYPIRFTLVEGGVKDVELLLMADGPLRRPDAEPLEKASLIAAAGGTVGEDASLDLRVQEIDLAWLTPVLSSVSPARPIPLEEGGVPTQTPPTGQPTPPDPDTQPVAGVSAAPREEDADASDDGPVAAADAARGDERDAEAAQVEVSDRPDDRGGELVAAPPEPDEGAAAPADADEGVAAADGAEPAVDDGEPGAATLQPTEGGIPELKGILNGTVSVGGFTEESDIEASISLQDFVWPERLVGVDLRLSAQGTLGRPDVSARMSDDDGLLLALSGSAPFRFTDEPAGLDCEGDVALRALLAPVELSRLRDALPPLKEDLPDGFASLDAQLAGPACDPQMRLVGALSAPVGAEGEQVRVDLDLRRQGDKALLEAFVSEAHTRRMEVDASAINHLSDVLAWALKGAPEPALDEVETWASTVEVNLVPLGIPIESLTALAQLPADLRGRVLGGVQLKGPVDALQVTGGLIWTEGEIGEVLVDAGNLNFYPEGEGYRLSGDFSFSPRGRPRQRGSLALAGYVPVTLTRLRDEEDDWRASEGLELSLSGQDIPLAVIEGVVPDVRETRGKIQIQGTADGSLGAPNTNLTIRLEDGSLVYEPLQVRYTDMQLTAEATRERLVLQARASSESRFALPVTQAIGLEDEGTIEAGGVIDLKGVTPENVRVAVVLDDFWLSSTPEYTVVASSERIDATGAWPAIKVRGAVELDNGRIVLGDDFFLGERNLELDPSITIYRDKAVVKAPPPPPEPSPILQNLDMKLDLDLQRRLTLDVEIPLEEGYGQLGAQLSTVDLKTVVDGDVDVLLQGGEVAIHGAVETVRGTTKILNKEFALEDGSQVTFVGDDLANPLLDLAAVYQAQDYGQVDVQISGTASEPQIAFASAEYDQTDIISLLVFGRPASEISASEGQARGAVLAAALASFSGNVSDALGGGLVDEVEWDPEMGVRVGKALSDRLFLAYELNSNPDEGDNINQVTLEVLLTDQWYAEVITGDRQNSSADLYWRWLF